MGIVIVPCTRRKIWDTQAAPTAVPAREVYTDDYFATWCRNAEQSGSDWFILSTHYGLVPPDQPIENYDVPVGEARRDTAFLDRLRQQLVGRGVGPEDVTVLDWEAFQGLVASAFGVPNERVGLKKLRF